MIGASDLTIGLRVPNEVQRDAGRLREFVAMVDDSPLDRVCIGDHVSFRGGIGYDGLQAATALAALSTRVAVQTAVYLLPLRHPVPVARQVSSLAWLAPGRFIFGVGVGGEDPAEMRACGIDPHSRGQRLDESLSIVRDLLDGRPVSRRGGLFELDGVAVAPPPPVPVPIVVGGRSTAALRRTGRSADGWLGVWVSPRRYVEACGQVSEYARGFGRDVAEWVHGMHVWCGIGTDREAARIRLAAEMEGLYGLPFETFERYCPYGSPEEVADAVRPYVVAGCRSVNLIAASERPLDTIAQASTVRALLRDETG